GIDIFFTHWSMFDSTMSYGAEEDTPAQLQDELKRIGVRCEQMEADLASIETPRILLDAVEARLGSPSILVNNAAHDDFDAPFDQLDAEILDQYYAVNMRGTILLSVEFARRFTLPSGGRIINLTSGQGVGPMPGKLPYIATKGAIDAFT